MVDVNGGTLKDDLHRYLRDARAALLWKLDGLSEYQVRRPMTPHGTNLLGLVKHLIGCEIGYFGAVFDRPFTPAPSWLTEAAEPTVDMWATAQESRQDIIDLYRRACAHADATTEGLDLDHVGTVPTWPQDRRKVTLHQVLVHMLAETSRHAGHADVVRELIDTKAGLHPNEPGLPQREADYWSGLHRRIDQAARRASGPGPSVSLRPMTDAEYDTATQIREAESVRALTDHVRCNRPKPGFAARRSSCCRTVNTPVGHHLVTAIGHTNSVVGHAWIGPDLRSAVRTSHRAWLYDMYIRPSVRRQGYGAALLAALEELVRVRGITDIGLNVNADIPRLSTYTSGVDTRSARTCCAKCVRGNKSSSTVRGQKDAG